MERSPLDYPDVAPNTESALTLHWITTFFIDKRPFIRRTLTSTTINASMWLTFYKSAIVVVSKMQIDGSAACFQVGNGQNNESVHNN